MPEFTQFDSTKSMMRNLPPDGVAGLQRLTVRPLRRSPRPPAMTIARVPLVRRLTNRPYEARAGCLCMMAALYSCCHCGTALLSGFRPPLSIGELVQNCIQGKAL